MKHAFEAIQADVKQLKETINLQAEEIKSLKSEVLDSQISKASKCVIVKGLEPESLNESPNQLKTTFTKVLTDMGIESKISICDVFRIKSKTPPMPPKTKVHEHVKVAFQNSSERSIFMKNLKNLRKYKDLKITMDCPKILLPQYEIANRRAYDLRTLTPGTKTILTVKNQKIVLLAKFIDQNTFKEWKDPVEDLDKTECENSQVKTTFKTTTNIKSPQIPKSLIANPKKLFPIKPISTTKTQK